MSAEVETLGEANCEVMIEYPYDRLSLTTWAGDNAVVCLSALRVLTFNSEVLFVTYNACDGRSSAGILCKNFSLSLLAVMPYFYSTLVGVIIANQNLALNLVPLCGRWTASPYAKVLSI